MAVALTAAAVAASSAVASNAEAWPRVCVVGPLPPPSGGMANQCEQLLRLLQAEGVDARLVRTNAPCWPRPVERVPFLRAAFRLVRYLFALWGGIGQAQVVHLFANSGWSWHLLAMPAIVVARLRGVGIIVNYRGGLADEFLSRTPRHVHRMLAGVAMRVTPSTYLQEVFARHGLDAEVVPNIIDLTRFGPAAERSPGAGPHLIVTRNLEAIYDIPTALRAFAAVRARHPAATLTVAGSGPERAALDKLVAELRLSEAVSFSGRIDNSRIASLYASADCMLNPSTVDNMPISILEALACGVPVVSTRAGGIPHLVRDGVTALLVPVGDHEAMAEAALRVLGDAGQAAALRSAGLAEAGRYAWPRIRLQWQGAYRRAAVATGRVAGSAS